VEHTLNDVQSRRDPVETFEKILLANLICVAC